MNNLQRLPTEELLPREALQPKNVRDTLHAYQMAKRCNVKKSARKLSNKQGARINSISRRHCTPLALDEFNGPRGDFYREHVCKMPCRPERLMKSPTSQELLMSDRGAFITGADF